MTFWFWFWILPMPNYVLEHPVLLAILKFLIHGLDDLVMCQGLFHAIPNPYRVFLISQFFLNCHLDWFDLMVEDHVFPIHSNGLKVDGPERCWGPLLSSAKEKSIFSDGSTVS